MGMLPQLKRRSRPGVDMEQLFRHVVEQVPVNVMLCDADTFKILYANAATRSTLGSIANELPVPLDQLVGSSIDIFHKHPEHQRRLLADPRNLPHQARVRWGHHVLDLLATPLLHDGRMPAIMLTWSMVTREVELVDRFDGEVKSVVDRLADAAPELQAAAAAMVGMATATNAESTAVAAASEELAASAREISRQVSHAAEVSAQAVDRAASSNEEIASLSRTANEIGNVVGLIKAIAEQTNLLALNATIEAARAGDAGKGFAVVAQEVKSLAAQTARATSTIGEQVAAIQGASVRTVDAIRSINEAIESVRKIMTTIAAAVEEQNAATADVSAHITRASEVTSEVGDTARKVLDAAVMVERQTTILRDGASTFLESARRSAS